MSCGARAAESLLDFQFEIIQAAAADETPCIDISNEMQRMFSLHGTWIEYEVPNVKLSASAVGCGPTDRAYATQCNRRSMMLDLGGNALRVSLTHCRHSSRPSVLWTSF